MEVSDEMLAYQAGQLKDAKAFNELVRRHQPRILLLHKHLTRDAGLAEDLCQETFMRAWQKLNSFTARGSFSAWLGRLAYREFLQNLRRIKRRPQMIDADISKLSAAPARDDLPDLNRLLAAVEPEEQLVLVLNYGHGLSHREISDMLGVPAGTIKSQIHRAKEKIRQHFKLSGQPEELTT